MNLSKANHVYPNRCTAPSIYPKELYSYSLLLTSMVKNNVCLQTLRMVILNLCPKLIKVSSKFYLGLNLDLVVLIAIIGKRMYYVIYCNQ
jgi:hypothetical protein